MERERSLQGIIELASAYYGSAVLFAALEVDLFTRIAQRQAPASAADLAARAGLEPRGARLLLDACVAIGLLRKSGETYANTEAGAQALVAGGAHDVTQAIRYNRDVYAAWGQLAAFARSGRPVESPACHLGDDPARTRRFVMAMHGRALGIGRMVVPLIDLSGCTRVLDLAGGPGTYAVLLAQAHPALSCVTVDLPAVSAVAAELVAAAGMTERVTCRAGDYHADVYEEAAFDAVTIFGALHQEAPEMIVSILTRARAALRPGGRLFVLDMMTDATHTQPAFSALFAVNMALTTDHGWVFSDEELHGWLRQAGFETCATQHVPPPMPHWLVTARKPAH
ncbi:MAG: methyltransferase [Kiritimatiellia bacterium]|jgi:ubiquinone/menaquinone biosynthesis C-methylase UbiE|nr:methyltransferase [Kiritimatiellia bacterium]MDD4173680.1 methyltransferase [Kiritimatiellia bacterium]MDD4442046.1 methyltransferase [Kiritimatiellia bacterium]MDX9793213.1 methyltransferase [Kiritimatiellia bacterium]NLC80949.1 methyltransferase domain-containing protein [Lentisphaerota bacterium]